MGLAATPLSEKMVLEHEMASGGAGELGVSRGSLGLQLVRRRGPLGLAPRRAEAAVFSPSRKAKGPHSVLGVGLQGTNVGQRGRVLRCPALSPTCVF